jgi:hypothetical protein
MRIIGDPQMLHLSSPSNHISWNMYNQSNYPVKGYIEILQFNWMPAVCMSGVHLDFFRGGGGGGVPVESI